MRQQRLEEFAAAFAATTVNADPQVWVEPTDHNLGRVLTARGLSPGQDELYEIRHVFRRTYSDGGYGPQLPQRRITYHG